MVLPPHTSAAAITLFSVILEGCFEYYAMLLIDAFRFAEKVTLIRAIRMIGILLLAMPMPPLYH